MYTERIFLLLALLFVTLQVADTQTTENLVQEAGMSFEFLENDVRQIESNPFMRHMIEKYGFRNTALFKILTVLMLLFYLGRRASVKVMCIILYCASGFYLVVVSSHLFLYYFY